MTTNHDPNAGVDETGQREADDSYTEMPGTEGEHEPGTLSHPLGQRTVGRFEDTGSGDRRSAELISDQGGAESSAPAQAQAFDLETASYREMQVEAKRRGLPGDGSTDELRIRLQEQHDPQEPPAE